MRTDWTGWPESDLTVGRSPGVDLPHYQMDDLINRAYEYDPVHFEDPRPMDPEYLTHSFLAEHLIVGRMGMKLPPDEDMSEEDWVSALHGDLVEFGVEFAGVDACVTRMDVQNESLS